MMSIYPHMLKFGETAENRTPFAVADQGSRDSEIAVVLPICVGEQFLPVSVRLVSSDAELLLWFWVIGKLDATVGFGRRKFHIAHAEWHMETRNKKNRCVFPLPPTSRGYAKLEEYFPIMGNCEL